MVWRNRGRCRFRLVPDAGPFFAVGHAARGAAFGDLDNDGDIDVVINRMDDRPAVLLNESEPAHWIRLELVGTKSNRSAIGTAVEVHAGGRVLHRQVKGGGSYASANDPRLLIGVGKAERVDRVEIRWPSGRKTVLTDPAPGTDASGRRAGRSDGEAAPRPPREDGDHERSPAIRTGADHPPSPGRADDRAGCRRPGLGRLGISRSRPSLDEVIALADAGKAGRGRGEGAGPTGDGPRRWRRQPAPGADPPQAARTGFLAGRTSTIAIRAGGAGPSRSRPPTNPAMAVTFHLCRGNALNRLLRLDEAEAAWLEALKVDPAAPEAGWNLLTLYYVQGREDEARRLALRLYRVEPDPHDRVSLLLELVRPDAHPPAPGSVIKLLEPVVRHGPKDLHSALALGLSLTRANQIDEGIDQLRRVVRIHPDRVEAWDGLLTGLDESGRLDDMEEELDACPRASPIRRDSSSIGPGSPRTATAGRRPSTSTGRPGRPSPTTGSSSIGSAGPCATWARSAEADRIERRVRTPGSRHPGAAPALRSGHRDPGPGDPAAPRAVPADRRPEGTHVVARGGDRLAPTRPRERPQERISLAALARLGSGGGSS